MTLIGGNGPFWCKILKPSALALMAFWCVIFVLDNPADAQSGPVPISRANCAQLRTIMADSGLTAANPRIAPRWQALGCDRPRPTPPRPTPPNPTPPNPTPAPPNRPVDSPVARPATPPSTNSGRRAENGRPAGRPTPATPGRTVSREEAADLQVSQRLRAARGCSEIDVIALDANWTRNHPDVVAARRRLNCDLLPVPTPPSTPTTRPAQPSRPVTRPLPAPPVIRTPRPAPPAPPPPPVVVVSPTVPAVTPIRPDYNIIASRGLSAWNRGQLAEGRQLLEQACTGRSAIGCDHLGTTLITPNPTNDPAYPLDASRAHILFYQACATLPSACQNGLHLRAARAHAVVDANGRPEWVPDPAVTRYFFEGSGRTDDRLECNDKPGLCFWLGMAYRRGIGGAADPVRGLRFVQRACAGGRGLIEACEEYAEALVSGSGVAPNIAEALRISDGLCLDGSAPGCLIIQRRGSPNISNTVGMVLDISCRGGNVTACIQAADRWFNGIGVAPNAVLAVQQMEAICARTPPAGNRRPTAYACEWIAARDEERPLVGVIGRAINREQYRFLACRYGSERSCTMLSQPRLIEAVQGR